MPPLPRAACPVCRESVAVRVTGELRWHNRATNTSPSGFVRARRRCEGSGRPAPRARETDLEDRRQVGRDLLDAEEAPEEASPEHGPASVHGRPDA